MSTPEQPSDYAPTARTTHKRLPDRGSHNRELVHSILDEALWCHVGFDTHEGPVVIPTIHVRVDETLYVHGSPASRTLRTLKGGVPVCVTVSIVDGLVLARSAFHHSMNYRSVVVFGRAHVVDDVSERSRVLDALVDHVVQGRRRDLRPHTEQELRATTALAIPLAEASAKVRSGGPADEPGDMGLPVWAGVLPLHLQPGDPIPDPELAPGAELPRYLSDYTR